MYMKYVIVTKLYSLVPVVLLQVQVDKDTNQPTIDPLNYSVKFTSSTSGAPLTCFFEFQGAEQRIGGGTVDL